jgi:hypothetical protein
MLQRQSRPSTVTGRINPVSWVDNQENNTLTKEVLKMKTHTLFGLLACPVLAMGLAFTACTTSGGGGTGDGDDAGTQTGTLRVLITDKPFPLECIEEAIVTITRVEARRAGDDDVGTDGAGGDAAANENGHGPDATTSGNGNGNGENGNGDGGDDPFIVLSDQEQDFNLLDLQGGVTDLLAEATIPVGTYTQLRLIVTEGVVTLNDGRQPTVTVPSGEQTGIKLHLDFEVTSDEATVLLLDVDLSRAFKPIPGTASDCTDDLREFHFSPSIAMRLIEMVNAGSISGTVTDTDMQGVENALVTAYTGEEEVTSTATVEDGTYTLSGLPAGEYRLEISAASYQDAEVPSVAVEAGQTVEGIDVTLTPEGG